VNNTFIKNILGDKIANHKYIELKIQIDWKNKAQHITIYINNSRVFSKFKDCSPLKFSCNLTGARYKVGYYSYTYR